MDLSARQPKNWQINKLGPGTGMEWAPSRRVDAASKSKGQLGD